MYFTHTSKQQNELKAGPCLKLQGYLDMAIEASFESLHGLQQGRCAIPLRCTLHPRATARRGASAVQLWHAESGAPATPRSRSRPSSANRASLPQPSGIASPRASPRYNS